MLKGFPRLVGVGGWIINIDVGEAEPVTVGDIVTVGVDWGVGDGTSAENSPTVATMAVFRLEIMKFITLAVGVPVKTMRLMSLTPTAAVPPKSRQPRMAAITTHNKEK